LHIVGGAAERIVNTIRLWFENEKCASRDAVFLLLCCLLYGSVWIQVVQDKVSLHSKCSRRAAIIDKIEHDNVKTSFTPLK